MWKIKAYGCNGKKGKLHLQKVKDVYLQDFSLDNMYDSLESSLGKLT